MKKNYTVFISYRREGAVETASLIAEKLRHAGYEVFMDIESLRAGKFNEQLYAVIEQCTDVIVVLPKDGLDRCSDRVDWVRQEVLFAMHHRKNIIPVMLRDFAWPMQMPEGMEELKNYQSIAAGNYDYFDAAIEKLKGYLQSKPMQWSKKRIKRIVLLCAILAVVIGGALFGIHRISIPICREGVDKITAGMSVIDLLGIESDEIDVAWNEFYKRYAKALPQDTAFLKKEIRQTLNFHRQQVEKLQNKPIDIYFDNLQRWVLQLRGINPAEIDVFFQSLYPSFFEDVYASLQILEDYLLFGDIPELSVRSSKVNRLYFQYAANGACYAYLELLSQMPEEALKTYRELSTDWKYLPSSIGLYLPLAEYERLQKIEAEKAKALLTELGAISSNELLKLQQEEKKQEWQGGMVGQQTAVDGGLQAEQDVSELAKNVGKRQRQLQERVSRTEELTRRILAQCRLEKEDEQYVMWGKIIRVANVMDKTRATRTWMKLQDNQNKVDMIAKGFDTLEWFEVKYTVSTADLLREINTRLDEYVRYFPDARSYVPVVKAFYTEVESGRLPIDGMVVIGTKDNLPHPLLRIGDIVFARNGKTVHNADEYESAKKANGEDLLEFYRYGANLQKLKRNVQPNQVLVGFLQLKEGE